MKVLETITATGTGVWDKQYQINLITRRSIYQNYQRDQQKEFIVYAVEFQSDHNKSRDDRRIFTTSDQQISFINRTFTGLNLKTIAEPVPQAKAYFLLELIDKELSSVTFVEDYLQLAFGDKTFNFYRWPEIHVKQTVVRHGQPAYRSMLESLIGRAISAVDEYLDIGLAITFNDKTLLTVSLSDDENDTLTEYAQYQSPSHWMIWRQSEHS